MSPGTGDPVATLRRIAFLLERGREDTYKVKAFRGAAAALLPMSDEEVGAAVEAGTLTDLPGVGASSARVIEEAVRGRMPERLARLEEEYGGPVTAGGQDLRAALRGDLHSHSDWSDGGSPIEEMAFTAIELGHDYLVLTDHSPRLKVARGLSAERLTRQLGVVDAVNEHLGGAGFTLLKGIEVDILDDGGLDQTDELLGPARRPGGHRALQAEDGRGRDDQADGRRHPQPADERARPLHRPSGDRQPRHPPGLAVRRADRLRGLRRARRRGRDQLPARAARPARRSCWSWRATSAACSRSTATRTPRGSSTSSASAASGPSRPAIDPDRIVNTWPKDRLLAWANR